MSVIPKISTAPNVVPFASIDLTDQTTVSFGNPIVNDLIQKSHLGVRSTVKRSIQRVLIFDVLGLTVANKLQLDEWKHNRIRLRPFANYDGSTVLYHSFQRTSVIGAKIGFQIGEEPTHSALELSGQQGEWSYVKDNGDIQVVEDDTPGYEKGPWEAHGFKGTSKNSTNAIPTHPITGNRVFTTIVVDGGSATSTEVDYGDSPVIRSNGVRMEKTAHLVGPTAADEFRTVTLSSVSGTTHSYFVYLKGAGQVTVKVWKNFLATAVLLGSHQQTLDGTWQRFDIEDFTKLAGDDYTFHIIFDTPGQCFVGPFNLTTDTRGKNADYVHAETGTASQMDTSEIQFPNIRIPDAQHTLSVGVRTPISEIVGNIWAVHKDMATALHRIGIVYSGASKSWTFWNKDDSQTVAFDPGTPGADIVITGCADPTDLRIFENGIKKNTKSTSLIVQATETKGIHIGDGETNQSGMLIGWIRLDNIKQSDAAILAMAQLYINPEERAFTLACEGRSFEIVNMSLVPLEGNPDQYDGVVQLIEVDSVEQSTTELQ